VSAEDVELVRGYYEALNRGDHESAESLLAPEIVADYRRRPVEPGIAHGREEASAVARSVRETWEWLRVEPVELIEVGGHIVAVVENTARGGASGAEVRSVTAHAWTLRDGRAVRFEYFGSKREALEAVGGSEG
jgi:uncharacterized protein